MWDTSRLAVRRRFEQDLCAYWLKHNCTFVIHGVFFVCLNEKNEVIHDGFVREKSSMVTHPFTEPFIWSRCLLGWKLSIFQPYSQRLSHWTFEASFHIWPVTFVTYLLQTTDKVALNCFKPHTNKQQTNKNPKATKNNPKQPQTNKQQTKPQKQIKTEKQTKTKQKPNKQKNNAKRLSIINSIYYKIIKHTGTVRSTWYKNKCMYIMVMHFSAILMRRLI